MTDQLIQETVVRQVAPQPSARDPLLVANLLSDLDGLMEMLVDEIANDSWINAFLLAAGANQVAEDRLHEGSIARARIAKHVARVVPGAGGRTAAAALRATDGAVWAARSATRGLSRLDAWQLELGGLVDKLADAVAHTAGVRPNPTLTLTPGYNSTREPGLSPWMPAINFDFLFPTNGKRSHQPQAGVELDFD